MAFHKVRDLLLRRRLVKGRRWMLAGRSMAYSLLEPEDPRLTVENRGSMMGAEKLVQLGRFLKRRLKNSELVGGGDVRRPPKGHLVVYVGAVVGEEEVVGSPPRRYVVPVVYFNHPLFRDLLREVEEEYGFHHHGGITIPCSVCRFERVKARIAGDSSG